MNQHHTHTAFAAVGGGIPGTQMAPFQQRTMEDSPLAHNYVSLRGKQMKTQVHRFP